MGSRKVVDRSLATVTLPGGLVPVVDALNDVVVVAELDGSILFANAATEALLGWSPAELVGRPLVDLVPERLRSAHLAGMSRFVEGGEPRLIGQPRVAHAAGVIDVRGLVAAVGVAFKKMLREIESLRRCGWREVTCHEILLKI